MKWLALSISMLAVVSAQLKERDGGYGGGDYSYEGSSYSQNNYNQGDNQKDDDKKNDNYNNNYNNGNNNMKYDNYGQQQNTPMAQVMPTSTSTSCTTTTWPASATTPALAQNTPALNIPTVANDAQTPTPVMNAAKATHTVAVGGQAGLVYSPEQVWANPGDIIFFIFMPKNHTITQSTFDNPCKKLDNGTKSGFKPYDGNGVPPTFSMEVKDTKPSWYYCGQKGHCEAGMVFAVNPTEQKTFAAFKEKAKASNGTANGYMSSAPAQYTTPAAQLPTATSSVAASCPTLAQGSGVLDSSGACSCSCSCGAIPIPNNEGIGSFGGIIGMVPIS